MQEEAKKNVRLNIPFSTMVRAALFLLLVFVIIKLIAIIAVVYVAAMIAVVIAASARWLEKYKVRRGVAVTLIACLMFAVVLGLLFVVIPMMFTQMRGLIREAPRIAARLEQQVPAAAPYIKSVTAQITSPPDPGRNKQLLSRGAVAGWYVVEALTAIFLTLVLSIYLAIEGKRSLAWLFSFAPEEQRRKLVLTAQEAEPVLLAYMRGQMITSSLAAVVALLVLIPLHVPAAIPLAFLAFVGDLVPVIGFLASVVPAMALGALHSAIAPLIIIGAYAGYHVIENYYVLPRIYGKSMRLSTLTVLLSVTIGGALAGPAGAVLILPLVAVYPPVERIWLRRKLADDTIRKHDAIEGEDEERAEQVIEDVMDQ